MDLSFNYLYIIEGCVLIIFSFSILYTLIKKKKPKIKQIEYSKCPKCKTAYDYQKLDKGVCPTCHIQTIETEEYFKQFPKELKKKES